MGSSVNVSPLDPALETEKIFIDTSNTTVRYSIGNSGQSCTPDFSCVMIGELHDFYYRKFSTFRKCKETGKEIYEIAQFLEIKLQPILESIYEKTIPFKQNLPDKVLCHIMDLESSIASVQQYIGQELFSLDNTIRPVYKKRGIMPMNLNRYMTANYQPHTPTTSLAILREILNQVVEKVYRGPPNIQTQTAPDNTIYTQISGRQFQHTYVSKTAATVIEAEANAIYRFLKYISNIRGYTIVDENYPALFRLLSMVNSCTEEMDDLQFCAIEAVRIIDGVYTDIKSIHNSLTNQSYHKNKKDLMKSIRRSLKFARKYHRAAHNALQAFDNHKQEFNSTKFRSCYCPRTDQN